MSHFCIKKEHLMSLINLINGFKIINFSLYIETNININILIIFLFKIKKLVYTIITFIVGQLWLFGIGFLSTCFQGGCPGGVLPSLAMSLVFFNKILFLLRTKMANIIQIILCHKTLFYIYSKCLPNVLVSCRTYPHLQRVKMFT